MTHGIIDGKLNSVGPWLNDDQWSNYVMNYMGRGTAIRELYLYPQKLNEIRSKKLAEGLIWANKHKEQMLNSGMILGDPRKNEVYGFRGHDHKGNSYISIRNPKFIEEEVLIYDIGLNSEYYRIVYPYDKVCRSKDQSKIKIPAESVIIIESMNNKFLGKFKHVDDINSSIKQKIGANQVNIRDNEARLNVEIPENASANLIITLDIGADLNIEDNDVTVTKTRKTFFNNAKWKVDIVPLSSGNHNLTISSNKSLENILKLQLRAQYIISETTTRSVDLSQNTFNETINIY